MTEVMSVELHIKDEGSFYPWFLYINGVFAGEGVGATEQHCMEQAKRQLRDDGSPGLALRLKAKLS